MTDVVELARQAVAEHEEWLAKGGGMDPQDTRELELARAVIAMADIREALKPYVQHAHDCRLNSEWHAHKGCDCGLSDTLRRSAEGGK